MPSRWIVTSGLCLSLVLSSTSPRTWAFHATAPATPASLGCGDYSIIANPNDRAELVKRCGSTEDSDRLALIEVLDRLNPVDEARASAGRGDFRLAAVIGGGPPPPGQRRKWDVEGVDCRNLDETDIAFWFRMTDSFYSPSHGRLQSRMRRFAAAYNAAMAVQQGFPQAAACDKPVQ
jgi:hypothetical protein